MRARYANGVGHKAGGEQALVCGGSPLCGRPGDGGANYIINYNRRVTGERSIQGPVPTALNNSEHGVRWQLVVKRGA